MDKRSKKRIKTRHFAKIEGNPGMVDDISEKGMRLSASQLPKKKKIDIHFEVYGQKFKIEGVIQWFIRRNTVNKHHQLGVIVRNPPEEYSKLVKQYTSQS